MSQEIKRESRKDWNKLKWKYTQQNLWDAAKVVVRRKFMVINPYNKTKISSSITLYLKGTRKKKSIPKLVERIINRAEISKTENRQWEDKSNEIKGFFKYQ
jgi:hypothetical protein